MPRKRFTTPPPEGLDDPGMVKGWKDMSVEDLSLPKQMVARLAKGVLPANTSIHRDALLALHKSATVFVSYIASTSYENAQSSGKKTISPQDVMAAMKECEFEEFQPRLEAELKKYNETQCDKRNTYRRKVKEEKAAAAAAPGGEDEAKEGETSEITNGTLNGHAEGEDEDRPAKKLKAEDGSAMPPDADGMNDVEMDGEQDGEADGDDADDAEEGGEDDDEVEEVDEDEDEDDEEGETSLIDDPEPESALGINQMRDEALDDAGSDSD